jgi:flagellar M-ring protein FliF
MIDQLKRLVQSLSIRQRILIGVAAVLVGLGIWGLEHWNKERDFKPLYTGLSSEDAGAIVARLKETGSEYRIQENGSVLLVPSAKVAELRLQMASLGLPKSGRIGYELFDKMNFGQTDFAEQVNYRRALEGELERSIMSMSEIEQARVHLSFAKDSLFTESKQDAKASVLVKLKLGAKLSIPNVDALRHLVSSAVEGLQPEAVSVVDSKGQVMRGSPKAESDGEASDRMLEFRTKIEQSLLAKVNATLEPLLGAQRFRAGVTIDCDFSSGDQSEETFDPNKSVMVTSQRSEDTGTTTSTGGIPGTQSNLPRPPARPLTGGGLLNRRTESVSFQTSRMVKHLKLPEGTLKRISASVLLDQRVHWIVEKGKPKRVLDPPTAEQLKAVKDLVAGVVGLDPARGDQVIVETMPFDVTLASEPPPDLIPPPPVQPAANGSPATALEPLWKQRRIQIIAGVSAGTALLLVGLVFLYLKRRKKKKGISAETATEAIEGKAAAVGTKQIPPAEEVDLEKKAAEDLALAEQQAREVLGAIRLPDTTTKKGEVLKRHIREEIKKSPEAIAHVLRTWLNASE